jgi:hypothetical protein
LWLRVERVDMLTRKRLGFLLLLTCSGVTFGATPSWLRTLAAQPPPVVSPDTQAVQLLDEVELVVAPDGKMRKRIRGAVRILRQEAAGLASVGAPQDSWHSVKDLHGWLIPANGKHVELRLKDAIETAAGVGSNTDVMSDHRVKRLQFSDVTIGAVVGFEMELDLSPLELADSFGFQRAIPVREARYTLKLPAGWSMLPTWINHAPVQSAGAVQQQWQWTLRDVPAATMEPYMPAWRSVAGALFVAFSPPDRTPELSTWKGIGNWFLKLSSDRRTSSEAIRSKVAALAAGAATELDKVRALAGFVQRDVRYVSIQLGIGGYQPHAAADVFQNRYGDCKDKATLLAVMLAEVGIDSMPVVVNSERTSIRADMPPSLQFDHVILAIRLPRGPQQDSLLATIESGADRLVFFDPTDEYTPFGRIRGELQGSVGLLAAVDNSRLITLPQVRPDQSGNRRTAKLVLNEQGVLSGEIKERITGQEAFRQRGYLHSATRESDTAKVVEARLAESLASFELKGVTASNREVTDLPLEWEYRIAASSYARRAGDLLMVRPRVLGVHAFILPEEKPRVHDLVLSEPRLHSDEVVIDLPAGYVVESLPPPVEVDAGFAVYRSVSAVNGAQLRYTRSYEVRALQVPAANIDAYRRLHREIARDERAVVVLKKAGP